jgi:hypothetical protein
MTQYLETDSLTNQDITGATALGAYTADSNRSIIVDVLLDQIAGNGSYIFYVTKQLAGAGSAYVTAYETVAVPNGVTAWNWQPRDEISVSVDDVLTVYVDGLAGDNTTPDTTVRWYSADNPLDAYDNAIWFNSDASNTNTVVGVDGIRTNPVSTLAAAATLAVALGIIVIRVRGTLLVDQDLTGYKLSSFSGIYDSTENLINCDTNEYLNTASIFGLNVSINSYHKNLTLCDCYVSTIKAHNLPTTIINSTLNTDLEFDSVGGGIYAIMGSKLIVAVPFEAGLYCGVTLTACTGTIALYYGDSNSSISANMIDGKVTVDSSCVSLGVTLSGMCAYEDLGTTTSLTDTRYTKLEEAAIIGSAMTLADDAITASKYDESTAFPLAQVDANATAIARTGADSDTLETISDEIAALPTAADNADAVLDEAETGHTGWITKLLSKVGFIGLK